MRYLCNILVIFLITVVNCQECGKPQIGTGFSVGGVYSDKGQWPWLAPLFLHTDDKFFCGSSIISTKFLLSASHCFHEKKNIYKLSAHQIYTLLGKYDLDDNNESGVVKSDIDQIIVNEEWKPLDLRYDSDVAVLKLKQTIIYNTYIQPVCLPDITSKVFQVEGFVAGYGFSEISNSKRESRPKHIQISSVTNEDCWYDEPVFAKISSKKMFCAGEVGKNPCRGDSGGGFFTKSGNSFQIVGIVSAAASAQCSDNKYVLFTSVPQFIVWIRDKIGDEGGEDGFDSKPLDCQYIDNKKENRFECYKERSFESTTPNTKISTVRGSFASGQSGNSVDTVIFGSCNMPYIPNMAAVNKKFPNFNQLFIVNSKLKHVEREKLALMPQLRILNFYGNEIENFPDNVFDDLVNLEILAFVNNKIKVLPPKMLWNLRKLKEFWSYTTEIETIPARFFTNNKEIEKIWMGYNKVKKIHVDFRSLPKLNLLDLRENTCIDAQACPSCAVNYDVIQEKIDENC